MVRVSRSPLVLAALACTLLPSAARASEDGEKKQAPPAVHGIAPQAADLLQRMSSFLAAAPGLRFHADVVFDEVSRAEQKLQFGAALDVALSRPGHLFVGWAGDRGSKGLWIGEEGVTLADGAHRVFATEAAGESLDATLAALSRERGIELPLSELLSSDPYRTITSRLESGAVLGTGEVDGVVCDHLALRGQSVDGQIWIQRGDRPLPRKIVLTYKKRPLAPQWAAVLSDWEVPATLPAAEFAPQVPPGFQRIAFTQAARAAEGSR